MKTMLIVLISLLSVTAPAQSTTSNSNELIPFYFEKSGVQISVIFRHSMVYASTRNLMVNQDSDIQPNTFLSFDFLPADKYFSCAARQLEVLGEALKSKEIQNLKNKFSSILVTVMILPTPLAAQLCPTTVRSSQKRLVLNICLDESKSVDATCEPISEGNIVAQYTKADEMQKAKASAETRMKAAAERLLQWIQP